MGRAIQTNPSLYGGFIFYQGFVDTINGDREDIGPGGRNEFGDLFTVEGVKSLMNMNVLSHMLQDDGKKLPIIYATAKFGDKQVPSYEVAELIAAAQSRKNPETVILKAEQGGHSAGDDDKAKQIQQEAEMLAFIAWASSRGLKNPINLSSK